MDSRLSRVFARCIATAILGGAAAAVSAQSTQEIQKIEAAMPAKAQVAPAKPRKLLVFSLCTGFKHSAVPYGEKALEIMGAKTGAFTTSATTSLSAFTGESLAQFDAVVINNATGEHFKTPEEGEPLLEFVRSGKGIIGIHAATDCCYGWPAYGEMMGGYFSGHPWGAKDTVTIKIDEPQHPIMQAFGGRDFEISDEIYQFKAPYSRAKLLVLASLNTQKTDMTKKGIARTDGDFAISWVREYGKGRVFYCSLGHNHEIFWTPAVLQHYLDGIQFALGDLKAPAAPRTELAEKALMDSFTAQLDKARVYEFGQSREALTALQATVREAAAMPSARTKVAQALVDTLLDKDAGSKCPLAAKQAIAPMLFDVIAPAQAVELATLLENPDPNVVDLARRTLQQIPGPEVDRALRDALAKVKGPQRAGLVATLGMRRDTDAAKPIAQLLGETLEAGLDCPKAIADEQATTMPESSRRYALGDEEQLAAACMIALGQIATPEAARILSKQAKVPECLQNKLDDARTRCIAMLKERGQTREATAMAEALYREGKTDVARSAGLVALCSLDPAKGYESALKDLEGDDAALRDAAAGVLTRADSAKVDEGLARLLDSPSTTTQAAVLAMVALRGNAAALKAVKPLATAADENVRLAAIRALGAVGDETVAVMLAETAAKATGAEKTAARESLGALRPKGVTPFVIALLEKKDAGLKDETAAELTRALGVRHARQAVALLLRLAGESAKPVQSEAVGALEELAGADQIDAFTRIFPKLQSDDLRRKAEKAAVAIAKRNADEARQADAVADALAAAPDTDTRASLLRVLGRIGNARALEAIRQAMNGQPDDKSADAAIRALADFPDAGALDDVLRIAETSTNKVHRSLALRGFVRMLAESGRERSTSETVALATKALDITTQTEERKMALGGLGDLKIPEILPMIVPFLRQEELRAEAAAAVIKLAGNVYPYAPGTARQYLEEILKGTVDESQKKEAEETLSKIRDAKGAIVGFGVAGFASKIKEDGKLLGEVFAPEKPSAPARSWKLVRGVEKDDNKDRIDLKKALGDKKSVAYLRCRVWAPEAREAQLEVGSDDGVKVWLNGKAVHEVNKQRACKPGEDKVRITLQQGWNPLMFKVVQYGGEWHLHARLASAKGDVMDDVYTEATNIDDNARFAGY